MNKCGNRACDISTPSMVVPSYTLNTVKLKFYLSNNVGELNHVSCKYIGEIDESRCFFN